MAIRTDFFFPNQVSDILLEFFRYFVLPKADKEKGYVFSIRQVRPTSVFYQLPGPSNLGVQRKPQHMENLFDEDRVLYK